MEYILKIKNPGTRGSYRDIAIFSSVDRARDFIRACTIPGSYSFATGSLLSGVLVSEMYVTGLHMLTPAREIIVLQEIEESVLADYISHLPYNPIANGGLTRYLLRYPSGLSSFSIAAFDNYDYARQYVDSCRDVMGEFYSDSPLARLPGIPPVLVPYGGHAPNDALYFEEILDSRELTVQLNPPLFRTQRSNRAVPPIGFPRRGRVFSQLYEEFESRIVQETIPPIPAPAQHPGHTYTLEWQNVSRAFLGASPEQDSIDQPILELENFGGENDEDVGFDD